MSNDRSIRYSEAQKEAIQLEMRRDPNVIIMGEDIAGGAGRAHLGIVDAWGGPFRSTKGLITEFGPERVRDTPISEAWFIGTAVGAGTVGMRPIVELMFIDFLGVCLDQLFNNGAKLRYMLGGQVAVPLTIITRIGAGTSSAAQHSESFYSIFTHLPGLKCVAPSDAYTAKGLLAAAIRDDDPVIVCDHKRLLNNSGIVPEEEYIVPLGKARVLKEGQDVTLVGVSLMTSVCMEAAERLAQQGVDAEVVDLLSLSPMDDEAILTSVRKTHRIVVVDEDTPRCSVATDIVALVAGQAFDDLDAPPRMVTAPHTPVPYSQPLERLYLPNADRVVATVDAMLNGS
ncbi:MAG: alpha-ketoacid dehydrogenase subunit beta [Chloroflexi bacterium]|nr:alpha-ketoacid dehydrogenase subunit beta [Chloroflexota bacterium]